MAEASTDELLADLKRLIDDGLFASAEILGSLLLARCEPKPTQLRERGDALALYADALFGKGEHKRARSYYREPSSDGAARAHGKAGMARGRERGRARLRLREAECGVVLDEQAAAIGSIEAVPVELRPAKARRYSQVVFTIRPQRRHYGLRERPRQRSAVRKSSNRCNASRPRNRISRRTAMDSAMKNTLG